MILKDQYEQIAARKAAPCPSLLNASWDVLDSSGNSLGHVRIRSSGDYITNEGDRGNLLPFKPGDTQSYTFQEPSGNEHPPTSQPTNWGIVFCLNGEWHWQQSVAPRQSGKLRRRSM